MDRIFVNGTKLATGTESLLKRTEHSVELALGILHLTALGKHTGQTTGLTPGPQWRQDR